MNDILNVILSYVPTSIFGSDVYIPYTQAYTWEANQMAHAMMGFFLAGGGINLTISIVKAFSSSSIDRVDIPMTVLMRKFALSRNKYWLLLIPLGKETIDFVYDWLTLSGSFSLFWREELYDCFTDIFFWSFGILLGLAFSMHLKWVIWAVLIPGIAGTILFSMGNLNQKENIDKLGAGEYVRYPNLKIRNEIRPKIESYIKDSNNLPVHLIITGRTHTSGTRTAIALGTELAIKGEKTRYLTAFKAIEAIKTKENNSKHWSIDEADIVIIDDLDWNMKFAVAYQKEFLELLKLVNTREKKAIWVIKDVTANWKTKLIGLFGANAKHSDLIAVDCEIKTGNDSTAQLLLEVHQKS